MTLSQLALEDVEALYLGVCCDDTYCQSTSTNTPECAALFA